MAYTPSTELNLPVEDAAKRLLGGLIEREVDGKILSVRIVEVEAYDQYDPASHTYLGKTSRNESMFRAAGHAYVYFIYGMHYCLNFVTGEEGVGSGVLIRAVEPVHGEAEMIVNRNGKKGLELTNGPSKLCEALKIDRELNGHAINTSPLRLVLQEPLTESRIVTTTRIGITKGADLLRRFYIKDNRYVSKK